MEIYNLTPEQQKAFNKLRLAAKTCEKLKIGFVNVLDTTYAYDRQMIVRMGVDENFEVNCGIYGYPPNKMNTIGGCSFADDQILHSFKLTSKGRKIFNSEQV